MCLRLLSVTNQRATRESPFRRTRWAGADLCRPPSQLQVWPHAAHHKSFNSVYKSGELLYSSPLEFQSKLTRPRSTVNSHRRGRSTFFPIHDPRLWARPKRCRSQVLLRRVPGESMLSVGSEAALRSPQLELNRVNSFSVWRWMRIVRRVGRRVFQDMMLSYRCFSCCKTVVC